MCRDRRGRGNVGVGRSESGSTDGFRESSTWTNLREQDEAVSRTIGGGEIAR